MPELTPLSYVLFYWPLGTLVCLSYPALLLALSFVLPGERRGDTRSR